MKRYIILLLAILAATTSCGSDVTDSSSSDTVKKDSNDTAHEVNYLESLVTDVYNGRTLRIFDANDHPEMHVNVALEEQNGDIVNDALYARDLLIEETFGIEVEYTLSPGTTQAAAACRQLDNSVLAGDNEWEYVISCLYGNALAASASAGTLYNLIDIPH